ncbi:MAG: hypothetical protein AAF354_12340, partial [Pseudomonadota bacterium]
EVRSIEIGKHDLAPQLRLAKPTRDFVQSHVVQCNCKTLQSGWGGSVLPKNFSDHGGQQKRKRKEKKKSAPFQLNKAILEQHKPVE